MSHFLHLFSQDIGKCHTFWSRGLRSATSPAATSIAILRRAVPVALKLIFDGLEDECRNRRRRDDLFPDSNESIGSIPNIF
jgi:hypothetical protein